MTIHYGIHKSPFGWCLIGSSGKKVAKIAFLSKKNEKDAVKELRDTWPKATLIRDDSATLPYVKKVFSETNAGKNIPPFIMEGTDFQVKVWKALLAIPKGKTSTYGEIARKIGSPKAVRAVGTACGKNPIGYIIPCHRVLTSTGSLGGYKWSVARKKAILASESKTAA